MKHELIGLLAETAVHPGAGQSEGEVDLPVAREETTGYPFVPGSGLKGALLDKAEQSFSPTPEELERKRQEHQGESDRELKRRVIADKTSPIFGKQNHAGAILVSDARLLLLPVRSLTSAYRWVTCPYVLERLARDCRRSAILGVPALPHQPNRGAYFGAGKVGDYCSFEERELVCQGAAPAEWVEFLYRFVLHPEAADRLASQLTIVPNELFGWFCRNALAVQARNFLDDDTKESLNLWYEETLPCDSVMYGIVAQRFDGGTELQSLCDLIRSYPFLQVGGNETVGQGWFAVKLAGQDHFAEYAEAALAN